MYFNMEKLLFPVKKPCELIFTSTMPASLEKVEQYWLDVNPVSGLKFRGLSDEERNNVLATPLKKIALEQRGETLVAPVVFPQEDRYVLRLYYGTKEVDMYEIYALEDDLYERMPYKGDTHLHSFLSTGGKSAGNESPEYVAAACRWRGLDFVSITDHHEFAPSQRCIDHYKKLETDFCILHGEEVHSPKNPVHIVNLGGKASVNKWTEDHRDEYDAALDAKLQQVSPELSEKDRVTVAACNAVFEKIQEYDGVAVLCHPFWVTRKGKLLNETQDVTDELFSAPQFDAYELMAGGAYVDGSHVQASYSAVRKPIPVLGCSDSHATSRTRLSLDKGYYTIVFAKELTEQSILEAIREGMCVAACFDRVFGPFRLVKYAYFAMAHMFPKHDELCERQGQELLRIASSREYDTFLLEQLDGLRDTPSQYYKSIKE